MPVLGLFTLLSCGNITEDFADKKSNRYLIDQTKKFMDQRDFDSAITSITAVLARDRSDEVLYLASMAYAGRAGLRILDIVDKIASDSSSKGILRIMAERFEGADADDVADIESAVALLEEIDDRAAGRSSDHNFFALFLYLSRFGVNLNIYALAYNGLRANFTGCHTVQDFAGASTGVPNSVVNKFYSSVPRIIDSATRVTASGTGLTTLLDKINSLPAGLAFTAPPCVATPNDVGCLGVRSTLNDATGIGLGQGGVCAAVTP